MTVAPQTWANAPEVLAAVMHRSCASQRLGYYRLFHDTSRIAADPTRTLRYRSRDRLRETTASRRRSEMTESRYESSTVRGATDSCEYLTPGGYVSCDRCLPCVLRGFTRVQHCFP